MPAEKRKEPKKPQRKPLQINDDVVFQQRTWIVERIGWIVMGLLLLAALAGVFAVGPVSSAEARDPSGLMQVSYWTPFSEPLRSIRFSLFCFDCPDVGQSPR